LKTSFQFNLCIWKMSDQCN